MIHKQNLLVLSAIWAPESSTADGFLHSLLPFCYHEDVWKRVAMREGARYSAAFLKHVVPGVLKPARMLWNQLIAFLFLCLGAMFGSATATYAFRYANSPASRGPGEVIRLVMAGFCTLIMAWYGIGSFLKARKISRS